MSVYPVERYSIGIDYIGGSANPGGGSLELWRLEVGCLMREVDVIIGKARKHSGQLCFGHEGTKARRHDVVSGIPPIAIALRKDSWRDQPFCASSSSCISTVSPCALLPIYSAFPKERKAWTHSAQESWNGITTFTRSSRRGGLWSGNT